MCQFRDDPPEAVRIKAVSTPAFHRQANFIDATLGLCFAYALSACWRSQTTVFGTGRKVRSAGQSRLSEGLYQFDFHSFDNHRSATKIATTHTTNPMFSSVSPQDGNARYLRRKKIAGPPIITPAKTATLRTTLDFSIIRAHLSFYERMVEFYERMVEFC